MPVSDPIGDMLTRIRNALMAKHEVVGMTFSQLKLEVCKILKKEGYVADYVVEGDGKDKVLRIYLKYHGEQEPAITGLSRISKPGLRKYAKANSKISSLGGLGTVILTTSSGIMTDREAKAKNVGGEILCEVW